MSTALILGLGRFGGGVEAARFLHRRGVHLRIADRSAGDDLAHSRRALADLGDVDWQLGREDAALLDGVDLLVANPAIPDEHVLLQLAARRGVPVTQEANLFLEHYPGRVIAITGTNGKSTTSTLLHRILATAGHDSLLGGNIGHSLLADEGRWRPAQIAVLEISSFQLERIDPQRHRLHGAICTRILKDHIDRHKTVANYHRAKSRIAAAATTFLVHGADDGVAAAFATAAARRLRFHRGPSAPDLFGVDGDWLTAHRAAPERLLHRDAMLLIGSFQQENALAAAAAAAELGVPAHRIGVALAQARPLPFRLQPVGTLRGVQIYDNAVSTEIESTRSALQSLPGRIHWVGGGKSKDGDYQAVADGVRPHLASAHLFGSAAQPLSACLAGVPTTCSERITGALQQAVAAATPGDIVLFSPAFASFDQYPNFRARALEFHDWLQQQAARDAVPAAGTAR